MNPAKFIPPVADWSPLCACDIQRAAKFSKYVFTAPQGYLMTEGLTAALQDQGKTVVWLRLDTMDCDPASCLLDIIHASQRVDSHGCINTILEMQRLPGPLYGWSHLFGKAAEELEHNLPPSAALVIEGLQVLNSTNPALIKQLCTFLDSFPSEMGRYMISQEVIPSDLMVDWNNALLLKSLTINLESCRETAKESGIQVSDRCLQHTIRLSGGSPIIFLGILDACRLLGPKYVENLVEYSSSQDILLQKITSSWLSCTTPEDLYACCLMLELGYYHPDIGQAVGGEWKQNSGPWVQPLQDGWQRLRSVWQLPLNRCLSFNLHAKKELLLKVADYLVKNDASELAMTIYLKNNEFKRAAELLASLLNEMMNTGQWLNMRRWLNEIPEQILEDWPWLIFARGEIEAMEGDESRAYINFSKAKKIFSQQHDILGLSYTLLGESTLDARQRDISSAFARARQSHSLVKEYEFTEQQVWADYQLGVLSATSNHLSNASEYLSSAAANMTDPKIAGLVEEAQAQVKEYDNLIKKLKHHRQELNKVEDDLQAGARKMKMLWHSRTDYLPALLEKYGWLHTPLMHKLPVENSNLYRIDGSGETKLIKRLLRKIGLYPIQKKETLPIFPIIQDLPLPPLSQTPTPNQEKTTQAYKPFLDQSETLSQPNQVEPKTHPTPQRMKKYPKPGAPKITVYCLGAFHVYQDEQPVEDWFSGKGKAIFKYLVTHRERPVAKEILMNIFWPDLDSDAARNNLNVAIYSLRQALRLAHPSFSHVIFQDDCYMLNPEIDIWLDSELFVELIASAKSFDQAGEVAAVIDIFNNAEALYLGEFMEEDRYEDWPKTQRQYLQEEYIKILDRVSKYYFDEDRLNACTTACRKILAVDPCREEAHRLMMQCFHLQDQPYLALRQYHQCIEALKNELQITPSTKTTDLYNSIRLQQDKQNLQSKT